MKKVYQIGAHTLIVGDSLETVTRGFTNSLHPDLLVIDPPYDMRDAYERSVRPPEGGQRMLLMWDDLRADNAIRAAFNAGWRLHSESVWDHVTSWRKPDRPLIRHRTCGVFYAGRSLSMAPVTLRNERGENVRMQSVYRHQKTSMHGHPHAKPIEWIRALIESLRPRLVLDPFLGSASTMVACEQVGVPCVGVEISEPYADDALKIIQSYSGHSPKEVQRD